MTALEASSIRRHRIPFKLVIAVSVLLLLVLYPWHGKLWSNSDWTEGGMGRDSNVVSSGQVHNNDHDQMTSNENHLSTDIPSRVAKISMLYGKTVPLYERAMRTHSNHAVLHNYPLFVLRNTVANSYWNKPYYILSKIIEELAQPPEKRVEWLMWFDADSVLLNPSLPLEIFLPPADIDDVHFIATKDDNGLNSGIFFVRIHEISAEIVAQSIAFPMFKPEIDLGYSVDQSSMQRIFNKTEFHPNVVYVPKKWINADVGNCDKGNLLVHFPGLVNRDFHMNWWLEQAEGPEAPSWNIPIHETKYPEQIEQFWTQVRHSRKFANITAEAVLQREGDLKPEVEEAVSWYNNVTYYDTDQSDMMIDAENRLKQAWEFAYGETLEI